MHRTFSLLLIGILAVPVFVTAATDDRSSDKALLADQYGTALPQTQYTPRFPYAMGWNCDDKSTLEFVGPTLEDGVCTVATAAGYEQGSGAPPIDVRGVPLSTPFRCALQMTGDSDVDPAVLANAAWRVTFPNAGTSSTYKASPVTTGDKPIVGTLPSSWKTGPQELVTEVTNAALYEVRCTFGPY